MVIGKLQVNPVQKATATAHCYLNGNIIDRQTKTVTLKCSASGKLS